MRCTAWVAPAAVCAILECAILSAQTSAAKPQAQSSVRPSFEVASVKLNPNCAKGHGFSDASSPGSLNLTCASLARLVQRAYVTFASAKMNPVHLQVIGGPRWMDSEQFDIAAKAPGDPPQGQMYGPMLQVLLEDRFHLKLHGESRELPVYNLMVASGGIKIQPMKEGGCTAMDVHNPPPPPAPGQSPAESCGNFSMRRANGLNILDGYGFSISGFGSVVSGMLLDRPVIDKTGVTGTFDIHLEFAPDVTMPSIGPPRGSVDNPGTPSTDNGPSIFTAMQEQLGLKLEPAKGPVEVIVIDHSEYPSAN
jgi:uncharacterized protein (TIGR03435 family)